MSNIFTELFVNAFVKGVGKTSGTVLTLFVGWQVSKFLYGHNDVISFIIGQKLNEKKITELKNEEYELEHEEINLEDVIQEDKTFKKLFDKL